MLTLENEKILDYCINKSNTPTKLAEELESYTKEKVSMSQMLVGKMEASFLGLLLRAINAKRVLEIGTFTGYSALAMAENLPDDGELITLDINLETTEIAKSFWQKSPHGKKITPMLGSATEIIPSLPGTFDFVFIDADKENYLNYLNISLNKLTSSGIIVIDNVLWSGKVLDKDSQDSSTEAIKQINNFIAENNSLYGTLLPIRDGIFLVKKVQNY
ncbi:MAG: methyltransferase [Epsilonproteobacteria bacterium]|nr:MAG: methyltransferase [Campylobacterota bacterium]RLA64616.1 MAG: methyltransferase [Campylobacterota bacterium]